ncbi:hypothetical protein [Bacteriovorax sp. Seq25_V]|uniref:hypothetical protein n=1 Tax=Bacteriovorax sp. Seq25_V TaxID=1201288 RepID=UPI00038A09F3|nr:hypothetical protein [Bacteriovorax sp. Seq25_V]EQC43961.1 hypothetical protein M900_1210 [Bacteriovorax sp. Seq25_V]
MNKSQDEIDWSGIKFKIMKELGECIDIIFIKENRENTKKKIFLKSHDLADGLSAITELLEIDNNINIDRFPIVKAHKKPSQIKRLILAYKHLKRQSPVDYNWKIKRKEITGTSPGLAYFYFTNEQTTLIKKICEKRNINTNTLILWALDKVAGEIFVNPTEKKVWMVPVNIRDSYEQKYKKGNHATALSIITQGNQKPENIHKQIKEQMKSGIIWGGKIVANAPKLIGEKRLRKIGANAKSPYLGLCSNLGEQPFEDFRIKNKEQYQWLVFPPSIKYCPISVCIMTWDGRLGISCQLHPSIVTNIDETKQFLEKMYNEICEELNSTTSLVTTVKTIKWEDVEKNGITY